MPEREMKRYRSARKGPEAPPAERAGWSDIAEKRKGKEKVVWSVESCFAGLSSEEEEACKHESLHPSHWAARAAWHWTVLIFSVARAAGVDQLR